MIRSASRDSVASAPVSSPGEQASRRFRLSCRMLRNSGKLDHGRAGMPVPVPPLPGQRRGESPIDWMVRLGLAMDVHSAAEALIAGQCLTSVLEELLALEIDA